MANLSNLGNITPLNLSTNILSGDIIKNSSNYANLIIPFWFLIGSIGIFIGLVTFLYNYLELDNYDIVRIMMFSSYSVAVISYLVIKAGFYASILPFTIFSTLWFIFMLVIYYIKKKE